MVNLWNVPRITLGKLLRAGKFETFWLKQHRHFGNMHDNPFLPPSRVKGMKVLDKEQFTKTITVPCFYLPLKSITASQKCLKHYILKLQNFRPITTASIEFIEAINRNGVKASPEEGKMAILDPRKVSTFEDIEEKDRSTLVNLGFDKTFMAPIDLVLNYDNFKADEVLRAIIPSEFESVSGYSLIGHIVHLNLREHLFEYKQLIGMVLLDKIKPARSVVNKVDIIDNTFRNFQMELLCGDNDMVAKVRSNKCTFEFDFSKVYWNPRLCTEHERIVESLHQKDVLYDVFCGVGPFAIPAAKKGCIVLANDLNPNSVEWLKSNSKLNKIGKNLQIFNKDGKEFIKKDVKEHILTLCKEDCHGITIVMNLPALAMNFLPSFQHLFSAEEVENLSALPTPRVIVYCFVKGIVDAQEAVLNLVSSELGMALTDQDEEINDIFFVRDVAPNKKMMRLTLHLTKRILLSRKRSLEQEEMEAKKICH